MLDGNRGNLSITTVDNEPRILDTDLGERLGMADPRKVRQNLITANREELESYGPILKQPIRTGLAGRPATAYYLNREQAILVCMFSRTEKAAEVRAEVIRVFAAYTRGELVEAKPSLPDFGNPAAARAWADEYEQKLLAHEQVKKLAEEIEVLKPKADVGDLVEQHLRPLHVLGRGSQWRSFDRFCLSIWLSLEPMSSPSAAVRASKMSSAARCPVSEYQRLVKTMFAMHSRRSAVVI